MGLSAEQVEKTAGLLESMRMSTRLRNDVIGLHPTTRAVARGSLPATTQTSPAWTGDRRNSSSLRLTGFFRIQTYRRLLIIRCRFLKI